MTRRKLLNTRKFQGKQIGTSEKEDSSKENTVLTTSVQEKSKNESMMANRRFSRRETIQTVVQQNYRTKMTRKLYREIRRLQRTTSLLIPKAPFSRLVREIFLELAPPDTRIQSNALAALQEACEMYMSQFFEDAYYCTLHGKRKTLQVADMQLVRKLRGLNDIVNR